MNDLRFYAVYPSTHGGRGQPAMRWSKPLPSAVEAQDQLKYEIDSGNAPMGFVVRAEGNVRTILASFTQPKPARKVIERYLELLRLTIDHRGLSDG